MDVYIQFDVSINSNDRALVNWLRQVFANIFALLGREYGEARAGDNTYKSTVK